MGFVVKPECWSAVFPVPSKVVDENIKLAGAAQLKALLWMLRYASEGFDIDKLAHDIGQSKADSMDALQFWIEKGIIIKTDGEKPIKDSNENKQEATPPKTEIKAELKSNKKSDLPEKKKDLPDIPEEKPTYQQIIIRLKETPELQMLFIELEKKFGRTIGYNDQSDFLMLYDRYGLPTEVILMLVEYCVSIGKRSNAYIIKVGKNWAEREIDTLEKADAEIERLKKCQGIWTKFTALTGIQNPRPTASQSAYLLSWTQKMKFSVDMLYIAYEEMSENTSKVSFPYMNKIIENWYSQDIKTPEEVENAKIKHKENIESEKVQKNKLNKSYDMDEFTERGNELPVYNKKGGAKN